MEDMTTERLVIRRFAFLAPVVAVCLAGCGMLPGRTAPPRPHVIRVVTLSYLKPGDQILLMDSGQGYVPVEVNQSLALKSYGSTTPLTSYRQLQGHVVLSNGTEALAFVRLHTTLGIGDVSEGQGEMEVTTDRSVISPQQYAASGSGFCGVLSARAFRLGGFAPPVVSRTALGFQIVRWTFDGNTVRDIREDVCGNGFYSRKVLKQTPPPKLPGTVWCLAPGIA